MTRFITAFCVSSLAALAIACIPPQQTSGHDGTGGGQTAQAGSAAPQMCQRACENYVSCNLDQMSTCMEACKSVRADIVEDFIDDSCEELAAKVQAGQQNGQTGGGAKQTTCQRTCQRFVDCKLDKMQPCMDYCTTKIAEERAQTFAGSSCEDLVSYAKYGAPVGQTGQGCMTRGVQDCSTTMICCGGDVTTGTPGQCLYAGVCNMPTR